MSSFALFPQLGLLRARLPLAASAASDVAIAPWEAWGERTLGPLVQVHRDFCLITPQLPYWPPPCARDSLFSNPYLPNRLAVSTQPAGGLSELGCVSVLLTLGLSSQFSHTNNIAFLRSGESRMFFSPRLWRECKRMNCFTPNFNVDETTHHSSEVAEFEVEGLWQLLGHMITLFPVFSSHGLEVRGT